jgi:hypothetical protein
MSTNSIFILKPIWDALYEDAKRDREEMDTLKKKLLDYDEERVKQLKKEIEWLTQKVAALELENATLKSCAFSNPFAIDDIIDDKAYAAEANAPSHTYVEEKAINEIVLPIMVQKEDDTVTAAAAEPKEESTKTVKMVGEKTKKEYQREYQRAYRKKQKSITMLPSKA